MIRPLVHSLRPYTPGEQPKIPGLIKLNTNENPYPPSPAVLRAIQKATDERLRLYPNPTAQPLREALARFHKCKDENIFVGNGSDEILSLAVRAFVEPKSSSVKKARATVQYFTPSYSLYPVLAAIQGAEVNEVPLNADFALPPIKAGQKKAGWKLDAALSLVTTPNAPSGHGYRTSDLETFCARQEGVVLLDEAYVDFAEENAIELAFKYPNVLVARTFSKAYSLCFLRVGYCVGDAGLIEALDKIRDSYNVNGLGQVAALSTLQNLSYYRANFRRVIKTRERLSDRLRALGFEVLPSQTNFILTKPQKFSPEKWLQKLREAKILVRWFKSPEVKDYLRISIGTEREADALINACERILKSSF